MTVVGSIFTVERLSQLSARATSVRASGSSEAEVADLGSGSAFFELAEATAAARRSGTAGSSIEKTAKKTATKTTKRAARLDRAASAKRP